MDPAEMRAMAVQYALDLTRITSRNPDAEVLVLDAKTIYDFLKDITA